MKSEDYLRRIMILRRKGSSEDLRHELGGAKDRIAGL
jgi:hypothetical protein